MFVVAAQKGRGPLMFYNGHKFASHGKREAFPTFAAALKKARELLRTYPMLDSFKVTVRKAKQLADVSRAAKLLKSFSGHDVGEVMRLPDAQFKTGIAVGPLLAIGYETVKNGETAPYLHEFKKDSRPLLAASSDGKMLRIVGGRFRFTAHGIEDI